ncbi:phosphate ABC transporter permease subunit PstC [Kovacikia minuta CCNUW1]|uniref:phosphate ABC transporter permease subunit PstC n=1 Tax=Kovacikia minuta TaxID=2931930 RepID=UPI001CC99A90|nr:phosphate ABC transporter permease subunit PstC [Kovacikia minuta]UBF27272.1 phosphate ABC transporter permease subunit PstC [Kovacikia minuta CCNUW1]
MTDNLQGESSGDRPPTDFEQIGSEILATGQFDVWVSQGFGWLVAGIAGLTTLLLFWIGWVIFERAQPAIQAFGWGFLTSQEWNIIDLKFGALPYIYGTLVSSAIALILAVPIGLAAALVTSEKFLPPWVRSPLAFVIELIAAIPSVIIGLWGIFVLIPVMQPIQLWLYKNFSQFPLFSTEPFGPGMLVAGVILAIMILPTIAAISRDVLLAVPSDLRTASMALGATRWETIFRVLLPTAVSGVLGAAILGLGRALGETMAVTMVIGNSAQISPSLLNLAYTIPAVLANEFAEALDDLHIGALMYLALILFGLTLAVNVAAVFMVRVLNHGR